MGKLAVFAHIQAWAVYSLISAWLRLRGRFAKLGSKELIACIHDTDVLLLIIWQTSGGGHIASAIFWNPYAWVGSGNVNISGSYISYRKDTVIMRSSFNFLIANWAEWCLVGLLFFLSTAYLNLNSLLFSPQRYLISFPYRDPSCAPIAVLLKPVIEDFRADNLDHLCWSRGRSKTCRAGGPSAAFIYLFILHLLSAATAAVVYYE